MSKLELVYFKLVCDIADTMSATVGSLLQYKEEFYGRRYRNLPKRPFDTDHEFLSTINQNVLSVPVSILRSGSPPDARATSRRKYVLFCSQKVWVHHPLTEVAGCNYIKCFISDPYENDTTDGWLREDWVEPYNGIATYFEDYLFKIKDKLKAISDNPPPKIERKDFEQLRNWHRIR